MPPIKTVHAKRYLQPLREGGSLPAVVDTDDGLYVVKFRGAGQGPKALVAELIVGLLAAELGLPVPELALVDLAESFGRSEPDPEIQDLLRASHGLNVGLRYLDGAFNFDLAAAGELVPTGLATDVVWLDAFTTNPDRTHRNPNLLVWNRRAWLIDHGSALYAHHNWEAVDEERARTPFPLVEKHVLLARSADLEAADRRLAPRLTAEVLAAILAAVPGELLEGDGFASVEAARERYLAYFATRLEAPRAFVATAAEARERVLATPPERLRARR